MPDLFKLACGLIHQPTQQRGSAYEAIFSEGRAEFRRRDGAFELHTDNVVSPEDDIELRRVRITNLADHARAIELARYAEVVLAPAEADALHPAFSMRQINAVEADAQLYARLANAILYGHGSLRAEGSLLMRNRRGQLGLWDMPSTAICRSCCCVSASWPTSVWCAS